MTIDLWCLVGIALWTLPLVHLPALSMVRLHGLGWGTGNRDVKPETPAWLKRAERAASNHQENLPMFAIVVLVVHVTGKHDDVSAIGSVVYVIARLLHALLYWTGVHMFAVRTLAYYVGVGALLVLVSRLF